MKTLLIMLTVLNGCITAVNTKGSINNIHYKLIKNGAYNSAEVQVDSTKCPILETELNIDGNLSKVKAVCKTVIKLGH